MIYDVLSNAHLYDQVHPGIAKGLKLLASADFSTLKDGRYEEDGDNLFMTLSTYVTKGSECARLEAHVQYADIQYLVTGRELIGVAPLSDAPELLEARPESDISFYRGIGDLLPLTGARFMVLFPGDAHAPCIQAGEAAEVRKAVVKVKL